MRVSRRYLKNLGWLAIVALLIQFPTSAVGESTKPAFVSPGGRNVPVGSWQGFFYPNAFLPLSYLPNINAVTEYQRRIFGAVLPPCDGSQAACISEVSYQIADGSWKVATPTSDVTQRDVFQGSLLPNGQWELHNTSLFSEDVTKNRPQGDAARVWIFSEAPHGGGNTYQVSAQITGGYDQNGIYNPDNFLVQVIPQKRVRMESSQSMQNCLEPASTFIRSKLTDTTGNCVTNYDFPQQLNIRVKIRLGSFLQFINGWFDSRIRDLLIDINNAEKVITIEGKPLIVPTASSKAIKYSELESLGLNPVSKDVQERQTKDNLGTGGSYPLNTPQSIEEFIKIGKNILPNALGENTVWQLSSLPQYYYENTKCLNKGIINGIVSTNATVYDSTAPKWSESDSSLNFRVGAAHHLSNSEVFKGYYSMIVNDITARCYWGNNLSSANASISILGQDGQQNIATTSVVPRNGWTYFNASGFTFSVPTIKVKFIAPTPTPTPTPSLTPTPTPIASAPASAQPTPSVTPTVQASPTPVSKKIKKITITCIKGTTVKKVTAVKPVCPKGFKKK